MEGKPQEPDRVVQEGQEDHGQIGLHTAARALGCAVDGESLSAQAVGAWPERDGGPALGFAGFLHLLGVGPRWTRACERGANDRRWVTIVAVHGHLRGLTS